MVAACLVRKNKLYCKHYDMKSSNNTSTCFKKQQEEKQSTLYQCVGFKNQTCTLKPQAAFDYDDWRKRNNAGHTRNLRCLACKAKLREEEEAERPFCPICEATKEPASFPKKDLEGRGSSESRWRMRRNPACKSRGITVELGGY